MTTMRTSFGIFLAMAQARFYKAPPRRPLSRSSRKFNLIRPHFSDVTVHLLTHGGNASEFVVYKAVVTASFLQRFSDPATLPKMSAVSGCGMDIEYTKVSFSPLPSLAERLGRALGPEISGDYFSGDGTRELRGDKQAHRDSSKRRRDEQDAPGARPTNKPRHQGGKLETSLTSMTDPL